MYACESFFLRGSLYEPDQPETLRNVKRVLHWRLPCYLLLMRRRSLAPKQVDAHGVSRDWGTRVDRSQGNAHRSIPGVRAFINARLHFEAGVPGPAVFVVGLAQVDIKIDPFASGRDFKLFIALDIRKVGANEHFSDVPIP